MENWGIFGVDVFFVISGFLMAKIQMEKNKNAISFIVDRIIRIVPLYWFLTILYSLGILVFSNYLYHVAGFSFMHFISSMFFISGLALHKAPIITVGWSLEYELLFYTFFSLSILIFKKIHYVVTSTAIIIILFFLIFDCPWHLGFEFIFGMLLAFKVKFNTQFRLSVLAMFLLFAIAVLDGRSLPRAIIIGFPSAMILYLIVKYDLHVKIFSELGNFSYEIYLIQVFVLPISFKLFSVSFSSDFNINLISYFSFVMVILSGFILKKFSTWCNSCIYRR